MISSVDFCKTVNKRHDKILRDIRRFLERQPEYVNAFEESSYINLQNKLQPCYLLTEEAVEILKNKYKFRNRTTSLEKSFYMWLKELFPNETIITQYPILNYKLDFYFKDIGIIIEYDEKEHKYRIEEDIVREREIIKYFKKLKIDIVFIRVKEGQEIQGIRRLLIEISNKTDLKRILHN